MSETLTLESGSEGTTLGTYAAALEYIDGQFSDASAAWLLLETDDRYRSLIAATRYLDRQTWQDDYDTFAERDALEAFQFACYELAAAAAEDKSVLSSGDQGSNIQSLGAGGASISYFNPTSNKLGSAPKLPQVAQDLVGQYLAGSDVVSVFGGDGNEGSDENPFSDCEDYDRGGSY
jgi:hypothetical protein